MDKTLRTAATGLAGEQRFIEIISNNLANVNTTGFKKVRPEFQDLLYETLRPEGNTLKSGQEATNEVQIGSGTEIVATTRTFSQGDLTSTSNSLDVAIKGDGFFVVKKADNSYGYTRDGSFKLDNTGKIVTAQGYSLDPSITVPTDATEVQISETGVVSVLTPSSTSAQYIGNIQLARFVNSAGLNADGKNLFSETAASGQAILEQPGTNNTGTLVQSSLESSNVDLVQEMVNMIVAQRAYEVNSKAVNTADNILQAAVNLKRS